MHDTVDDSEDMSLLAAYQPALRKVTNDLCQCNPWDVDDGDFVAADRGLPACPFNEVHTLTVLTARSLADAVCYVIGYARSD